MRSQRRGAIRWKLLLGTAISALVLALLPALVACQPLCNWLIGWAAPEVNGHITVRQVDLAWLQPVQVHDLQLVDADGQRAVYIAGATTDRTLAGLLLSPSNLGGLRVEHPRLEVHVGQTGSNLGRLVQRADRKEPRRVRALSLELTDGVLAFWGQQASTPWEIGPIAARLALRPGTTEADAGGTLEIAPGTLVNRAQLTPQVCNDLLKFVLPVAANTTEVRGEFSIELDAWRLPLDEPQQGTGSGRFILHRVEVTASPIVQRLAEMLRLPPSIQLAEAAPIEFGLREGRIYHRDLRFTLRNMTVTTRGSVGFDQQLDLVAEITFAPGAAAEALLPGGVRTITIPIQGTLAHPHLAIDLRQTGRNFLQQKLDELSTPQGKSPTLDLLERLRNKGKK